MLGGEPLKPWTVIEIINDLNIFRYFLSQTDQEEAMITVSQVYHVHVAYIYIDVSYLWSTVQLSSWKHREARLNKIGN